MVDAQYDCTSPRIEASPCQEIYNLLWSFYRQQGYFFQSFCIQNERKGFEKEWILKEINNKQMRLFSESFIDLFDFYFVPDTSCSECS